MAPPVIETDRLTKRYGAATGIVDLSLAVADGEILGFLGPNGAGKTTTIRLLLDLLRPTSGRARVFGLDSRRGSRAIRARLGHLPGDFGYDERLDGWAVIHHFARLRGVADLSTATALAERFEADLTRPLRTLSRGNRQKVGLIQALFHDPELLVLDEPTAGLDPLMQEEFLAMIGEYRAGGGTVFLSSHELDAVERICDRVALVRDGALIAVESVEDMRTRAYRDVAVRFADPIDLARLARVPGVEHVLEDGAWIRLRARGDIDPVLTAVARHRVRDIEISRPSLEELFLTYYAGEVAA